MSSPAAIVTIYEALRKLALDPLADRLGVNLIELADRYMLGPDLYGQTTSPAPTLNCLVVSPLTPVENVGDAAQRLKRIEQPLQVAFVFKRGDLSLSDVAEKFAAPLHEVLMSSQLRRLGNLKLSDTKGREVGHVTALHCGEPDFFPPDNDDLYPAGLACFTLEVRVSYVRLFHTDD
jgi:hypothetical protein